MPVPYHIDERMLIKDALYQRVDTIGYVFAAFRHRRGRAVRKGSAIAVGNVAVVVNIFIPDEIAVNVAPLLL